MKRRLFVQAGVSSLFISKAAIASSAAEPGRDGLTSHYFFFDERFTEARRLASALSGTTEPTPVQSDVTALWTGQLERSSRAAPMAIRGVTTESFYFCLKVLLSDRSRVDAQVRRIDQDLYLWTIRSENHTQYGTVTWQNPFHQV